MKHKMISAMIAAAMALSAAAVPAAAEGEEYIEWIIGEAEAQPGEDVAISVTVKNDVSGINSYILDMNAEGGITAVSAETGTAYEALSMASNLDSMIFAGTNYTVADNIKAAEDGAVVFTVIFHIPESAQPGVYNLTFDDLLVYDMNMNEVPYKKTAGTIKVLGQAAPGGTNVNLGDVDEDGDVDAADAANILVAAAAVGAGGESGLTEQQQKNADVNGNGGFDSTDAAYVLQYAAAAGAGYSGTINDFMASLD